MQTSQNLNSNNDDQHLLQDKCKISVKSYCGWFWLNPPLTLNSGIQWREFQTAQPTSGTSLYWLVSILHFVKKMLNVGPPLLFRKFSCTEKEYNVMQLSLHLGHPTLVNSLITSGIFFTLVPMQCKGMQCNVAYIWDIYLVQDKWTFDELLWLV